MKKYIVKIKGLEIPYCIKNYKKAKTIKIFFKEDMLTITKSPYIPIKEAEKLIYSNEDKIYEQYKKILQQKENKKSNWQSGQTILYKGEIYTIQVSYYDKNNVNINVNQEEKRLEISMSKKCIGQEEYYIKKIILQLFKRNIENLLRIKLPYWSSITNIEYKVVKVRDAISKYGSCMPKTKDLHFSSRLIMLKDEAIDAVVVHELCHIIHPNHSKDFYKLVESYIPNYKQLDKYLKECSKYVRI